MGRVSGKREKERENPGWGKKRETENAGLGQTESRSQELHLALPTWVTGMQVLEPLFAAP